ncbi:MAG: DNA gyrase subunit A [Alphaproteobacteria bacterium]|nr:DNA gyrase subunit A [Alphaproteobacteria bacterium]
MTENKAIPFVNIEDEMKNSYLDYAMSVIVSRALPDVRDGLKPVHRRILYAMYESGFDYNRPHKKSAHIVGGVIAKYHPHSTEAVYDSLVRMAQLFSLRLPLIDSQGNFGSMDGDPAAAMRYTEARLSRPAHYLLIDIDKETVDFKANYDESTVEPTVLPSRIPNLLVNGAGGIAVGMATNIPSHNLGEVIDGCCALIENPDLTVEELMEYIPGPDFPTGGLIMGRRGIYSAFKTGRGSLVIRSRTHIETIRKDREAIIVTEIPYQVNKAKMIERMAELVINKELEGISHLQDESDRNGVRVVIELKKEAIPEVVLNRLYTMTPLQTSFGVNMLALNGGRPQQMGLKEILECFILFREEVITRRTQYELKKARDRAHILVGLALAVANLDEMIALIRKAPDPQTAKDQILSRPWAVQDIEPLIQLIDEPGYPIINGTYKMSEAQAKAILDLRLHRLTGLEREKIAQELHEIVGEIKEYLHILSSRDRRLEILRTELIEIKENYATPRRTTIEDGEMNADEEDLIQREDMVVTVSLGGYIKRVPVTTYRAQKRGGKGRSGMATREEDAVSEVFVANTHTQMLFFTTSGRVFGMKVYKLPLGTPQARGKAIVNLLPLEEGETISTIMPMPDDEALWEKMHILFATSSGQVRRNALSDFTNIRANGKIAMKLEEGEQLIAVSSCDETNDVLLTTKEGRCIRFAVTDVREFVGRTSTGVRGIRLTKGDKIVSMSILHQVDFTIEERDAYLKQAMKLRRQEGDEANDEVIISLSQERFEAMAVVEEFILSVSENGFGKRSSAYEYRCTNRGGQGITTMDVTAKTGKLVDSFPIKAEDDIMLVTNTGKLIRCPVHDIRIAGRRTQGVTLFRVDKDEAVVSVARIQDDGQEELEELDNG